MRFAPISYADRLTIVNPHGDVGIATQVAADMAVGSVSHALWFGAELTRAEAQPERG